jgi:hypothetical protein
MDRRSASSREPTETKTIYENELVVDCVDFKTIDTGVILIGNADNNEAVGYVPNERLHYALPDETVEIERFDVPTPKIRTTEDPDARMERFLTELSDLRESLDRQVADLIDEGPPPGRQTKSDRNDSLNDGGRSRSRYGRCRRAPDGSGSSPSRSRGATGANRL